MKLAFWGAAPVKGTKEVPMKPVAQEKAIPAAQAAIEKVPTPSKVTRAWTWTKENLPRVAYSVAIVAALALIGAGLAFGATSPFAIAGYSLLGGALLGASIYEIKNSRNLDNHAKELYNAIKAFDDLNPLSNKYATAQERFIKAKQVIEQDLVKFNPSDKEAFIRRLALAAKNDSNFRINTDDGRYGVVLDKPNGATFEDFVRAIVDARSEEIQAKYDVELNNYAQSFAKALKNDVSMSRKIRHFLNEAAYKMSTNSEYRILGKSLMDVSQDLLNAVKAKLGESYLPKEIRKLESLMQDRYGFWSAVDGYRKTVKKEYQKKFEVQEDKIKELEKQLKDINDAENGMKKEWLSKWEIAREKNNSPEKIQKAKARIDELDERRKELNAKKEEIKVEIEKLKQEQAETEAKAGNEYLIDLNARRRELARLVGTEDQEDFVLPKHPTYGDKAKHWAPRAALGVGLAAGVAAGAYFAGPTVVKTAGDAFDWSKDKAYKAYDWTKENASGALSWSKGMMKYAYCKATFGKDC